MKFQISGSSGDTAPSDIALENNDVPELVPEDEEEQEMLNVQRNDVTVEYAQDKDSVQEGEGAHANKKGKNLVKRM